MERCALPLTGLGCADVVITDLGVFHVDKRAGCFRVAELAEGVSMEEAKQKTGAPLVV